MAPTAVFFGVVTVVAVGTVLLKAPVAQWLLAGLVCYKLPDLKAVGKDGKEIKGMRPGFFDRKAHAQGRTRQRKGGKAAARALQRSMARIGAAQHLQLVPMPQSAVPALKFFEEYDRLTLLVVVAAANLAAQVAAGRESLLLLVFAAAALLASLYTSAKATLHSKLSPGLEKGVAVTFTAVSFCAALAVLALMTDAVLDFEFDAAARELGPHLDGWLGKRGLLRGRGPTEVKAVQLKVAAAAAGALFGGLSAAAALRCARSYVLATRPPPWAAENGLCGISGAGRAALHAAAVAPLLASLLWVTPMWTSDPAGGGTQAWQAGGLVLTAAVQMAACRPTLQAFLHTGLVEWYSLKHGRVQGTAAQEKQLARLVEAKVDLNIILLCKVAVQASQPAFQCFCLGALLHLGRAQEEAAGEGLVPPSLLRTMAGFLGWWVCVTWQFCSLVSLLLLRTGILR